MLKLIGHRLLVSVPLLIITSMMTFILQALIPGDAARAMVGANGSEAAYLQLRNELHLNEPVWKQYTEYLGRAFHGDLGVSVFSGQSVIDTLLQRTPATLSVVAIALIICVVLGVVIGLSGVRFGGSVSQGAEAAAVIGLALPNFWIALILVSIFAVTIPIFPAIGYTPLSESFTAWLSGLVLPGLALSLGGIANVAKTTRVAVSESMASDYIRNLRACGVGERALLWRHGLRNSGVPIMTLAGLYAVGAMTGSLFVENVFAIPGLGSLLNDAIGNHDIQVIQGVAIAYVAIVIVINLATDLLCAVINPKLRAR